MGRRTVENLVSLNQIFASTTKARQAARSLGGSESMPAQTGRDARWEQDHAVAATGRGQQRAWSIPQGALHGKPMLPAWRCYILGHAHVSRF